MHKPRPASPLSAPAPANAAVHPAPSTVSASGQVALGAEGRMDPGLAAPSLHCLVLTTSDSRTMETDRGGAYAVRVLDAAGHNTVDRRIVADDVAAIRAQVLEAVERHPLDVLVVTGGTALGARDVTPEAIVPLFRKQLPGFGEALRRLAWTSLGPSAVLTRAAAGVIARTLVFLLPGAPEVVRLAMDELVLPVAAEACAQIRGGEQ